MILKHIELENTSGVKYGTIYKLMIIGFICFASCKSTKQDNIIDENIELTTIGNNDVEQDQNIRYFDLYCGDKTLRIKGEDLKWTTIDYDIIDCLVEYGFKGDEDANTQLSMIIDHLSIKRMGAFFVKAPKFRGEKVFKSLLEISNNHEPRVDFDGEYVGATKGLGVFGLYSKMIVDINGYANLTEYVYSVSGYTRNDWLDKVLDEPSRVILSKLTYQKVKEAYKANEIVFKPYGTE